MPPGAKKRKAAKKKQEQQQQQQQASSTTTTTQPNNLKSNNYDSRSQEESDVSKKAGLTEKESNLDTDERIEIIDSSHDHDKSSSSSSSGSNSSSSSDDESREVKKESEVITVSSVPDQPVPIAGDAPFMGATANVIVESTGLMDSADPKAEEEIEISRVETVISNEADKISLPKPNETSAEVSLVTDETKQASSSATATDSKVKENEEKALPLPKSSGVPEDIRESEVVISREEEAPVRPEHGVAQRTSWLSCCGLFDVMSGSSR